MTLDRQKLAAAVRARRAERGLTQVQVAELLGVGQTTINRVEAGYGEPLATTLFRLCDWLGVPPETFAADEDAEDPAHAAAAQAA